jgi:hypothetical protein
VGDRDSVAALWQDMVCGCVGAGPGVWAMGRRTAILLLTPILVAPSPDDVGSSGAGLATAESQVLESLS